MNDLPQFLYTIQPTRPAMLSEGATPEESESVSQHFNYLQKLLEEGVVLLAGRTQNTDPTSFGIIIFRAAHEEAAQQIMENDPAVKHGVMDAKLYPYRIALMASRDERS
jgi:uncharacterized protein YciI